MNAPLRVRSLQLYPLAIPLRLTFEHAAASRNVADPVVVRLAAEAPYGEITGHGETLARPYVTGETALTVSEDIRAVFAPRLVDFACASFAEVVEFCEGLPFVAGGRSVAAARSAVELALLDLAGRAFRRRASEATAWLDLAGFCPPGCLARARYSGVVVGRTRRKQSWFLRAQRWYGLRDFKIKVAVPGWEDKLAWAYRVLRPALANGRATLRADANGGWSLSEALAVLPTLAASGVSALEQPLAKSADADLPALARAAAELRAHAVPAGTSATGDSARPRGIDLIADESLVSLDDAVRLLESDAVRVFNVRIAKHGGLIPALRIAHRVLAASRDVQLGCLVGETSILAAAGLAFLEAAPTVRFVEGAFGRWLATDDVVPRPVQFGRAGRIRPRRGSGLGVEPSVEALERLCVEPQGAIML